MAYSAYIFKTLGVPSSWASLQSMAELDEISRVQRPFSPLFLLIFLIFLVRALAILCKLGRGSLQNAPGVVRNGACKLHAQTKRLFSVKLNKVNIEMVTAGFAPWRVPLNYGNSLFGHEGNRSPGSGEKETILPYTNISGPCAASHLSLLYMSVIRPLTFH